MQQKLDSEPDDLNKVLVKFAIHYRITASLHFTQLISQWRMENCQVFD